MKLLCRIKLCKCLRMTRCWVWHTARGSVKSVTITIARMTLFYESDVASLWITACLWGNPDTPGGRHQTFLSLSPAPAWLSGTSGLGSTVSRPFHFISRKNDQFCLMFTWPQVCESPFIRNPFFLPLLLGLLAKSSHTQVSELWCLKKSMIRLFKVLIYFMKGSTRSMF